MKEKFLVCKIAAIMLLGLMLTFCQKEMDDEKVQMKSLDNDMLMSLNRNPTMDEIGEIPKATVPLLSFTKAFSLKSVEIEPATLLPNAFTATLRVGESASESKTAHISGAPPKGDVLFMMDLTGSMSGELNNAKANSANIMGSITSEISDAAFGVVSHMDYPDYYTSCGYSASYGTSYSGDYPYQLDQSITSDNTSVSAALIALSLGNGADWPESYTRVLYETTADANINWRSGARKFVVAWLDAPPHDCSLIDPYFTSGTGSDPGRDGIMGTGDDLPNIEPILQEMKNQNITLIVLFSGVDYFSNWQTWAQLTGGDAFQINEDGTIPGDMDIAQLITDLILAQTGTISDLSVEVCTPGFETWLTDAPSWTDVDLTAAFDETFDLTFTVPEGTEDGVYEFDVCLVGDGAEYASQHVTVTVQNVIEVAVDIKPNDTPNSINCNNINDLITVAILTTPYFDATTVNHETVKFEGAGESHINKKTGLMQRHVEDVDMDGDLDLVFHFLLNQTNLDCSSLEGTLTGELYDGTPITGTDEVRMINVPLK